MTERRHYLRLKPDPDHPVRVDINGQNFLDILYARDISEGGLGFQVEHRFSGLAIGRPVHFIVSLPEPVKALLSAGGRIRHVEDDTFGIEFESLSRAARRELHDYLHHLLRYDPLLLRVAHTLHVPDSLLQRR